MAVDVAVGVKVGVVVGVGGTEVAVGGNVVGVPVIVGEGVEKMGLWSFTEPVRASAVVGVPVAT
jgi:hypothetical protein